MNNMPYPFMPDFNMMNRGFQYNKISELEQRVNRLERELHRLEKKVNTYEYKPLVSTKDNNPNDEGGIYMV